PPARSRADRRAARRGLRDRDRDQRHARAASRRRLDLREPEGRLDARAVTWRRAQARLPAAWRGARALRGPRLHALLPPADGRAGARGEHRARRYVLPRPPPMEAQPPDAQADRHSVEERRRTQATLARHRPTTLHSRESERGGDDDGAERRL